MLPGPSDSANGSRRQSGPFTKTTPLPVPGWLTTQMPRTKPLALGDLVCLLDHYTIRVGKANEKSHRALRKHAYFHETGTVSQHLFLEVQDPRVAVKGLSRQPAGCKPKPSGLLVQPIVHVQSRYRGAARCGT